MWLTCCMEENNGAKTVCGRGGVTPLQTTDFFPKRRQTAIVIMFSCNNDRYSSRRDGNDRCRQSRNTGGIFSLSDSPDFAHACMYLYIPRSPAVPRWPPVQKVWGTPVPIARGTQEGGCAWRGICLHLLSIFSRLWSTNQVKLHAAAVTTLSEMKVVVRWCLC